MASPLTIYPSNDAHVQQNDAAANFGTAVTLNIRNEDTAGDYEFFIKFSTADLPAGVTISSAILYLNCVTAIANHTGIETYVCAADWAEGTITWNNKPAAGGSNLHTFSFAATGWKNSGTSLTATFNSWYKATANNYGLTLKQTAQVVGGISQADSKETATPANKPYFIVTYTLPSGFFIFMT